MFYISSKSQAKACNQFKEKNSLNKKNAVLIEDIDKMAFLFIPRKAVIAVDDGLVFLNPLKVKHSLHIELICLSILISLFGIMSFSSNIYKYHFTLRNNFNFYFIPFVVFILMIFFMYFFVYRKFKVIFFKGICVNEKEECNYREDCICLKNEHKLKLSFNLYIFLIFLILFLSLLFISFFY